LFKLRQALVADFQRPLPLTHPASIQSIPKPNPVPGKILREGLVGKPPGGTEPEMAAILNVPKRFFEHHPLPAIQKKLSDFFSSGHYLMNALAG
jgi:hypothetical protein